MKHVPGLLALVVQRVTVEGAQEERKDGRATDEKSLWQMTTVQQGKDHENVRVQCGEEATTCCRG